MDTGALIGFVGVIITLAVNGWLQRVQHDREVEQERAGIRGTLFAELTTVLRQLDWIGQRYVGYLKGEKEALDIVFPQSFEMRPIDTIRPQFGKLTARQALAAINAINALRFAPHTIERIIKEGQPVAAQFPGEGPIQIPEERLANAAQAIRLIRDTIVRELQILDQDSLLELVDLAGAGSWCFDLETYLTEHNVKRI